MGRPSRFDSEFRALAVDLVRVSRKPRRQVAVDIGVSDTTLSKWMNAADSEQESDDSLNAGDEVELAALRAEKRDWIVEREVLKKCVAFWVKEYRG